MKHAYLNEFHRQHSERLKKHLARQPKASLEEALAQYDKIKHGSVRHPCRAEGSKARSTDQRVRAAYVRGRELRRVLQEAEGGSLSSSQAAARLRVSRATLLRWYHAGKVLGWKRGKSEVRFPVWQFHRRKLLPGLREVLAVANGGWELLTDYGRMGFLLANLSSLAGRRPLDLLREGDVEAVKQAVPDHLWP